MATVPGGLFDPTANPSISTRAADIVSNVLAQLGISESSTRQVTASQYTASADDKLLKANVNNAIIDLSRTNSALVVVTGSNSSVTGGGGADTVLPSDRVAQQVMRWVKG